MNVVVKSVFVSAATRLVRKTSQDSSPVTLKPGRFGGRYRKVSFRLGSSFRRHRYYIAKLVCFYVCVFLFLDIISNVISRAVHRQSQKGGEVFGETDIMHKQPLVVLTTLR